MTSESPCTPKKKQRLPGFGSGRASPLRSALGSMLASPSKLASTLSRTPEASRDKKRLRDNPETKENGSNTEAPLAELYLKEHGALETPLSPRGAGEMDTLRRRRNTIRLSTGTFSKTLTGSISQASSQVSLTIRSAKRHVYTDVRSMFGPKEDELTELAVTAEPPPQGLVFGRDLVEVMKQQIAEHPELAISIPSIVHDCVEYIIRHGLHTTGIFRLSASAVEVERLAMLYDIDGTVDLEAEVKDIHAVCCLLKKYLRELSSPLIPLQLDPEIQALDLGAGICGPDLLNHIRESIVNSPLLHPCHYNTLKHIIRLCSLVASESAVNKMDCSNLAVVFGPNLQAPPVPEALPASLAQTTASDLMALMARGGNPQAHVNHLVHILIANADFFFPLSSAPASF